jgi:hypothetical protein
MALKLNEAVGFGFVLAAARPPREEEVGDGTFRRHRGVYRAERPIPGGGKIELVGASEGDLLEKVASWAEEQGRRKDGGLLATEPPLIEDAPPPRSRGSKRTKEVSG